MDIRDLWLRPENADEDDYHYRKSLPGSMSKKNETSNLWSLMKSNIGKDLSKTVMPIHLNEPISFLQRICEYMEYSHLLFQACKESDPVTRLEIITAFVISAVSSSSRRSGKPFNPLLGETYELDRMTDRGYVFVSEQVSHHPPVSAFHARADPHFRLWGSLHPKIKFLGTCLEIHPKGSVHLHLEQHQETYKWNSVPSVINNILLGKVTISYQGETKIRCLGSGLVSVIKWKTGSSSSGGGPSLSGSSGIFSKMEDIAGLADNCGGSSGSCGNHSNVVEAHVGDGKQARVVYGRWSEAVYSVPADIWDSRNEKRGWRHQITDSALGNVVSRLGSSGAGSKTSSTSSGGGGMRFFHSSSLFLSSTSSSSQSPNSSSLEIPEPSPTEGPTYSPQLERRHRYYDSHKIGDAVGQDVPQGSNGHHRASTDYDLHLPAQICLWRVNRRPPDSALHYNFSHFTLSLMQQPSPPLPPSNVACRSSSLDHKLQQQNLPPTDSRRRPDIQLLEQGKMDEAGDEKLRLENKQRNFRKLLKKEKGSDSNHMSLWFKHVKTELSGDSFEWIFNDKYFDRNWTNCPDIY